ncbi:hypothetical protein RB596_009552 [Gaeumannomyces avenae]
MDMDVFKVRLNCIDHYQAIPTKYDPRLRKDTRASQLSKEPRVPVVRVFGSTETGQKVCAHIHGAFPYIFVEYPGTLASTDIGAYIYRLHLSIDHALAVSYRQNVHGRDPPKYVARITLVKGVPFYGFHVGYKFYLKIYMLNPAVMSRLADLLHQGVIMKRRFQPYEAHLQYLLQFMTDYNLYGCAYLEAGKFSFRTPVPHFADDDDVPQESAHIWHSRSIRPALITDDCSLPRASHCAIEVDICVEDILNRREVKERRLHHDFVERLAPLDPNMKLVHSMAGLWKDETRRRRRRMQQSPSDDLNSSTPSPPEVLVSMSADPRVSQPAGWLHEEELREEVRALIAAERQLDGGNDVSFDQWVKPAPMEHKVRTVLESVEDLYPRNLAASLGLVPLEVVDGADLDPSSSIEVNEPAVIRLSQQAHDNDDPSLDELDKDLVSGEGCVEEAAVEEAAVEEAAVLGTRPSGFSGQGKGTLSMECVVGVCKSHLASGEQPRVDVTDELLAAAQAEDLLVEAAGSSPSSSDGEGVSSPLPLKQHLDPMINEPEAKRPRVRPATINNLGFVPPGSPTSWKESRSAALALGGNVYDHTPPSAQPPSVDDWAPPSAQPPSVDDWAPPSAQPPSVDDWTPPSAQPPFVDDWTPPSAQPPSVDDWTPPPSSQRREPALQDGVSHWMSGDQAVPRHSHQSTASSGDLYVLGDGVLTGPCPPASGYSWSSGGLTSQSMETSSTVGQTVPCLLGDNAGSAPGYEISAAESNRTPRVYTLRSLPPTAAEVCESMSEYGLPDVIYREPFYSDEGDVPLRSREFGGRRFRLLGSTLPYLPEFDPLGQSPATFGAKAEEAPDQAGMQREYERLRKTCSIRSWEISKPPPTLEEVSEWCDQRLDRKRKAGASGHPQPQPPSSPVQMDRDLLSQIEGPTPRDGHGFKYSQRKKSASVQHEVQYMSTMSMELHVNTRGRLAPDPEEDEVKLIFWCLKSDGASAGAQSGVIVLSEDGRLGRRMRHQVSGQLVEEASELELMVRMVELVRTHDPDILTGYEVHGGSWGYLVERARLKYDYDLCDEFSRMKSQSHGRHGRGADRWGFRTTSALRVTGRHMINIWRAMRGELSLQQYSMENVVWHLLHRRIPHYSYETLTDWYRNGWHRDLDKLVRHWQTRVRLDLEILDENELVSRTSEQARLLGVDFFSVFSRGSQFKVESIMFRIAKPESFLLPSPSRQQVGAQNALECLPLVMEPQSAFYISPVVVLDFQSLYPSVMIAYNYCYSTFLGRIVDWRGANKMGFANYRRRRRLLELLQDHINIAPNGVMYTKATIRKSLLAKMLTEILETRVMVKSGMRQDKEDRALQRLLNNRQLALKLLANVTYGYTSASFSGRLPCSEIADSIVQTGRETLERAITFIHSVQRWGAEVVYGDTDSIFIHLRGRTKEQAFEIGNEMAKAITDMNPRPVKLKFEKVYLPCVLLAKKRYVGYKYESVSQLAPDFDAKGIETVRRDGTPAEQKIEEKALRLLFETADLSRVKAYFQRQCDKIMRGNVSIQDFCFAKEVKLGTYSTRPGTGPPPPGALISTKRMLKDARAEPQYGERVPYVVVTGAPGARLADRCVPPEDLVSPAGTHLRLDAEYYISKNLIPPLERIFNLVGAQVRAWYDEVPKVQRVRRIVVEPAGGAGMTGASFGHLFGFGSAIGSAWHRPKKVTLESYMQVMSCAVCNVHIKPRPSRPPSIPAAPRIAPVFAFRQQPPQQQSRPAKRQPKPGEPIVCGRCRSDARSSLLVMQARVNHERRRLEDVLGVCRSCAGLAPAHEPVECDSKDCPVFYTRIKQAIALRTEASIAEPVISRLEIRLDKASRAALYEW